jgi:hypothetical protein
MLQVEFTDEHTWSSALTLFVGAQLRSPQADELCRYKKSSLKIRVGRDGTMTAPICAAYPGER